MRSLVPWNRDRSSARTRTGVGLGLRWDFHESAALKVQLERIKQNRPPFLGINSVVYSPNMPPINPAYRGPGWDGRMNVLSVNLDFVF